MTPPSYVFLALVALCTACAPWPSAEDHLVCEVSHVTDGPHDSCLTRMIDHLVRRTLVHDDWVDRIDEQLLVAVSITGIEQFDPAALNEAWKDEGLPAEIVFVPDRFFFSTHPRAEDHHVYFESLWGTFPALDEVFTAARRPTFGGCIWTSCCSVTHESVCTVTG